MTNNEIRHLSLLKEKSGREGQGRYFIEGKRSVTEAISNSTSIERILVNIAIDSAKFAEIYALAEAGGIPIEEVPAVKFAKLASTETSQGIIAVANVLSTKLDTVLRQIASKRKAVVTILDRISDPGNLGTVLRSASWFGVDAVLTGEGSVDIYNSKVVRSAMAAIASLTVAQEIKIIDALSSLKSFGFTIVASSQDGENNYVEYNFPQKLCLIFGSEAAGVGKKTLELCDESVAIPRIGKMESLNVGVAASIILSEVMRQRSLGK